jgi:hypothetical protein
VLDVVVAAALVVVSVAVVDSSLQPATVNAMAATAISKRVRGMNMVVLLRNCEGMRAGSVVPVVS